MSRKPLTALLIGLLLAFPCGAIAQTDDTSAETQAPEGLIVLPAEDFDLDQYLWVNRVLVVFTDTPADPRYIQQMELLRERPRDLNERDVVVVTDTDKSSGSAIRKKLRPRGFALVMVDKDGVVKLRKPSPWSTREIARSIDKTPLRRQEIRERSGTSG